MPTNVTCQDVIGCEKRWTIRELYIKWTQYLTIFFLYCFFFSEKQSPNKELLDLNDYFWISLQWHKIYRAQTKMDGLVFSAPLTFPFFLNRMFNCSSGFRLYVSFICLVLLNTLLEIFTYSWLPITRPSLTRTSR